MLFESVACKFARTDDLRWLCVDAMNDDIKATVALGLLVAPAERSPAFLRAVCDHGTMRRTREIVQIYKTLPRDQHDDVLVNACIVLANVAKLSEPELRSQTLPVDDFVWMIPADKGHMYTTYALEGLAHTWRDDPGAVAGEFGQPAPSDGVWRGEAKRDEDATERVSASESPTDVASSSVAAGERAAVRAARARATACARSVRTFSLAASRAFSLALDASRALSRASRRAAFSSSAFFSSSVCPSAAASFASRTRWRRLRNHTCTCTRAWCRHETELE